MNVGDLHLYYFAKDAIVGPTIGIAKDGYATPIGVTSVRQEGEADLGARESAHRDDPKLPTRSRPGPRIRWASTLYLGWPTYHSRHERPARGGRHSSRGCIRLYPDDIAELYAKVGLHAGARGERAGEGRLGRLRAVSRSEPDPDQSLELTRPGRSPPCARLKACASS